MIHIYDNRDRLIARVLLGPHDSDERTEAIATAAADQAEAVEADGGSIRQAIYDGDSGELFGVAVLVEGIVIGPL